jgi:hypothetical protein
MHSADDDQGGGEGGGELRAAVIPVLRRGVGSGGGPVGPAVGPVARRKGKNPFSDRDTKVARSGQAILRTKLVQMGRVERAKVLKRYEEGNKNYKKYPRVSETDPGEWTGAIWICDREGRVPKHPDEPRHTILGYRPNKKDLQTEYNIWRNNLEDWFDYLNMHSTKQIHTSSSDEEEADEEEEEEVDNSDDEGEF